jgi:peptide/nickel transport system permease protein
MKMSNKFSRYLEEWKKSHRSMIMDVKLSLHLFRNSPLSLAGLIIVSAFVFISLTAPYISPYDPNEIDLSRRFQPPGIEHFFGTDQLGMNIFSRVLYGASVELRVGVAIVLLGGGPGVLLGLISGYLGGPIDELIMRTSDIFISIPGLILALGFAAALQVRTLEVLIVAISITRWPMYARLLRNMTLSLKQEGYVEAARACGSSGWRIITRHILPNAMGPILVQATLDLGWAILTAAYLSFIGFGSPPDSPEWGRMVVEGRIFIGTYAWIVAFPGLAIFVVVLGFNLLGDGLRDIFDPRLRR